MRAAQSFADQLWLFDCGGVDVSALRDKGEVLKQAARARRTIAGYKCDWRAFEAWCRKAGRPPMPATTETVELYVTWLLTQMQRKISTTERHVAAISHLHRKAGHDSPVSPGIRDIIRAVKRERKEKPVGKVALTAAQLRHAARKCDGRTALGCRDRAILVLGFASTLRRSELARLRYEDIRFERKGLAVMVRFSKRDQEGKGRQIGVWAGGNKYTDPVRALKSWIRHRGTWPGPLFCRIQTGDTIKKLPISGEAVNEVVKRLVTAAGLDPTLYGTHSLRAGGVTASAQLGRSDQEIMALSGHRSAKVMQMYVRPVRLFAGRNPLEGVL